MNNISMLIFSNRSESYVLKVASLLGALACLVPIFCFINGKTDFRETFIGVLLFSGMALTAFLIRRNKTVEVRVFDDFIDLVYPLKMKAVKIEYKEIQEVIFSDLGMSLSICLKNGSRISLGSTLQRQSGNFTVPELEQSAIQGSPGERLRLKNEIDSRRK